MVCQPTYKFKDPYNPVLDQDLNEISSEASGKARAPNKKDGVGRESAGLICTPSPCLNIGIISGAMTVIKQ